LLGQQFGKGPQQFPPIPGMLPGGRSLDPQKRPKTGQVQRFEQLDHAMNSGLYQDEVDLLDGQPHALLKRETVKVKHQIDMTKNMQINHEASLRAFNSQPSPGKKTPFQIKREAATKKHSTDVGLSQESQVIQSANYYEQHGVFQRSH